MILLIFGGLCPVLLYVQVFNVELIGIFLGFSLVIKCFHLSRLLVRLVLRPDSTDILNHAHIVLIAALTIKRIPRFDALHGTSMNVRLVLNHLN